MKYKPKYESKVISVLVDPFEFDEKIDINKLIDSLYSEGWRLISVVVAIEIIHRIDPYSKYDLKEIKTKEKCLRHYFEREIE